MQSVFQGNWGKVQDISRQSEDQQGATFTEHKLHEIPLEDECSVSPGRQTIRHQCKLMESISQQGGMQSSSSGQHGSRKSQGQKGAALAQHKFHDIPFRGCTVSSGHQTSRNQCNRTESSSQQGGMQSSSHMKQQQNQKPQDASNQSGSSGQGCRGQENRKPEENLSGSCSAGRPHPKGNKPQDTSSECQGSDR